MGHNASMSTFFYMLALLHITYGGDIHDRKIYIKKTHTQLNVAFNNSKVNVSIEISRYM